MCERSQSKLNFIVSDLDFLIFFFSFFFAPTSNVHSHAILCALTFWCGVFSETHIYKYFVYFRMHKIWMKWTEQKKKKIWNVILWAIVSLRSGTHPFRRWVDNARWIPNGIWEILAILSCPSLVFGFDDDDDDDDAHALQIQEFLSLNLVFWLILILFFLSRNDSARFDGHLYEMHLTIYLSQSKWIEYAFNARFTVHNIFKTIEWIMW